MNLKKIIVLLLFAIFSIFEINAISKYYRKHIILVVDQTSKTNAGGHLESVGKKLLSIFEGKDENGNITFDPSTDFIEVFLYGMEGKVFDIPRYKSYNSIPYNGSAYKIRRESLQGIETDSIYKHTIDALVHHHISATRFGNMKDWWQVELNPVFTTETEVRKAFAANGCYGLSAFLPYAVIPYINKAIPAQEYYIICVSTFKAGLSSESASHDIDILGKIYNSTNKAREFNEWVRKFAEPYVLTDYINISEGSAEDYGVSAIGKQLTLKPAAKSFIHITSNISIVQEEYGSRIFSLNKIAVSFPKDDNLKIKEIEIRISDKDNNYSQTQEIIDFKYDDTKKEYILSPQNIRLTEEIDKSSELQFSIIFTPDSDSVSSILPYVFIANRNITGNDIEFKPAPTSFYIMQIGLLVIISICLYIVYLHRAKFAKCTPKFNIWPISNSRYMDVSNNKVINYDCWYYRNGENEKKIQVSGNIAVEYPKFAAKGKLVAEYLIEDVDTNEDFSFRPDGRKSNNANRCAKEWYPLKMDENGDFEFEVVSFLNSNLNSPRFDREDLNILRLKVIIRTRIEMPKKSNKDDNWIKSSKKYHFIVRPEIENSDIWVSFDPGTSGSCIAYGWGGLPADTNNINLACSRSTNTAGNEIISPIFHSKIRITDHSDLFNGAVPEQLTLFDSNKGTGDFRFGNEAHIHWGRNSFQSIKKLLGYANELEVKNDRGQIAKIKGEDLAHLLIKGLCKEFEQFLQTDKSVSPYVRERLITDGHLTPSRAIVAVPNNYTVNKVQAMIDTIKRTKLFKEIHYLFEAEGVMMYYMNQNWKQLGELENKTFVVFDMGGATINATSFKIEVNTDTNNGNVYTRSITVDTVSRVGYTVGGDNIDFALIKIILEIPSIKTAIADKMKIEDFMRKQKKRLISFVQKLKLDYIETVSGNILEGNYAKNEETFWTELYKLMTECNIQCPAAIEETDLRYLKSRKTKNIMEKQVMSCIKDAISELETERFTREIILIVSGRSTLYPNVKEQVLGTLNNKGYNVKTWDYGVLDDSSIKIDEIVKTAVVRGACWYAMNSKYVALKHDSVTSTFGYTDLVNQEVKYIPVIDKNTLFDENGEAVNVVSPKDPTINTIKFIQMLGTNYDEIYQSKDFMHKMVELTQISQSQIRGNVKSIKIKVDSNNNFSYEISVAGETNPISGTCQASDADITDTNSEAYAFAALASLDDEYISENDKIKASNVKNTNKRGVGRF